MMGRRTVNLILLLALGALAAVGWTVQSDPSKPNDVFLPNMVESVPYDAFAENPNFADGKTLQPPPDGAIPRGAVRLHYGTGTAEAKRAGQELRNPFLLTDTEAVRRGSVIYGRYCGVCHGGTGKGDGPVAMRGFPPPPAFTDAKSLAMTDGELFHMLTYGGENMPSYATQVSQEDRWKAILFVHIIQQKELAAAAAAAQAPAPSASPAAAPQAP